MTSPLFSHPTSFGTDVGEITLPIRRDFEQTINSALADKFLNEIAISRTPNGRGLTSEVLIFTFDSSMNGTKVGCGVKLHFRNDGGVPGWGNKTQEKFFKSIRDDTKVAFFPQGDWIRDVSKFCSDHFYKRSEPTQRATVSIRKNPPEKLSMSYPSLESIKIKGKFLEDNPSDNIVLQFWPHITIGKPFNYAAGSSQVSG